LRKTTTTTTTTNGPSNASHNESRAGEVEKGGAERKSEEAAGTPHLLHPHRLAIADDDE